MRKFAAIASAGVFGWTVFGPSAIRAENLNLKFGPTWSCKMISAELNDLYESCRRCEKDGKHFNQLSPTGGECVDKQSLRGSKYDEVPPDLAREREIQQKIDDLVKEREALTQKRMREKQWRDSGVSGSSRAPSTLNPDAQAPTGSAMIDLLQTKTLVVPSYRVCDVSTRKCSSSSKATTLKATADRKWVLVDGWAHADDVPMEPNGRFVRRKGWENGDLGEVVDTGEVSTTPGQFILRVSERARSTSVKLKVSVGWDTTFVTTIDVDPSGNCQFRLEYTDTDISTGKTRTVRSESAACSVQ
jgi:hypothetical protein